MSADELLELAQRALDGARPDEEVEAFAVRERTTRIDVLGGAVESLSAADTRGIGVRVVADGRQGYAYTAEVDDAGLRRALGEARANAAVAMPDDANGLPDPGEVPELAGLAVDDPVDLEARIDLALELETAARDADPRVRGVDTATYADAAHDVALASTRGMALTQSRTDAWAFVEALARDGEETQSGLGLTLGRAATQLDVTAAGREAARRATRLLGARKPRSRRTAVLFDPYVTAQFLGVLAQALSAEAVLKQRSLFAGRLGDEVAAGNVTLLDDGLHPGAPGTAPWDGEGVAQQRTALIEDGRLASYLHDTWTARRTGGGATSTGNASRAGFKSSPGVAPTNLFLASGDRDADELIGGVEDGVYVQDVMGLHSGANPVSGEFSVSFSGLAIRDGQLADPIREAAVSSTIVDILRDVRAVGSDLRFYPFGGSLGGATVLVAGMAVSGT